VHFVQSAQSAQRTCLQTKPFVRGDFADLKAKIIAAVKNSDARMLMRVWQEIDYRINVCHVTRGAHMEHL